MPTLAQLPPQAPLMTIDQIAELALDAQVAALKTLKQFMVHIADEALTSDNIADRFQAANLYHKIALPLMESKKTVHMPTVNFNFSAGFELDITDIVSSATAAADQVMAQAEEIGLAVQATQPEPPVLDATEFFLTCFPTENKPSTDADDEFIIEMSE